MTVQLIALLFIASVACGYTVFRFLLSYIPRKMLASEGERCREIVSESRRQADAIRERQRSRISEELAHLQRELEESILGKQADLRVIDDDLDGQEEFLRHEEQRVKKLDHKVRGRRSLLAKVQKHYQTAHSSFGDKRQQFQSALQERSGEQSKQLYQQIIDQIIETRHVECQKLLKAVALDYNTGAKRIAQRFLSRVQARYSPKFFWPRTLNNVEVRDRRKYEYICQDQQLLTTLGEIADGVQVRIIPNHPNRAIRFIGGFGMAREAARLTLNDVLGRHTNQWLGAVKQIYLGHYYRLEREALRLGRKACRMLAIDDVHVELHKLIGSLNWRTSYRQNQWYHSLEVATLAGLLAHELGDNPRLARRCGLLHDIGKALDHKIDENHAIISGDYADRYGESRLVCNTVMSHHDDLIVETPLAYILKAADTLSGGRPGARVNLEEDYQSRLSAIEEVIMGFRGVTKVMIMNGAREIHIDVNHTDVKELELPDLSKQIADKLSEDVSFPGQICIVLSRKFEATLVA